MKKPVVNIPVVQMVVVVMIAKQENAVVVVARTDVVAHQKTVVRKDKLIFYFL